MTILPPEPGEPRRPHGPRDPGDAWVVAPDGTRYWGRFGAAGLLALDPERGVLLQHRVSWSHFGDTWGLPGGARHKGESAVAGAVREAHEEAGVPGDAIRPRLASVLDLGYWSYTTLIADVAEPFEPAIGDAESHELAWVPVAEIRDRPLHPGFAASWEYLRTALDIRPAIVVDAANVVGSVPDGWWRDRARATQRLLARLETLAAAGVDADALELAEQLWFPEWSVIVEGRARSVAHPGSRIPDQNRDDGGIQIGHGVTVVRAEAAGDDAITSEAARLIHAGRTVTVVTSDRALADRVTRAGASVRGTRWLLSLLD